MQINDLLKAAIESEASDLHLKAGNFPVVRIFGKLHNLKGLPRLSIQDTMELAGQITNDHQKKIWKVN